MQKLKKGQKLACVACGRKIVVNSAGISGSTLYCCGKPLARNAKKAAPKKKDRKK